MISVVILTYNEAINIKRCLHSVSWSDDVLVVDSGSNDETIAIAESLGARVVHRPFDNFANQRNYALDHGKLVNDWILHLDADEQPDDHLINEMQAIAKANLADQKKAFAIPFKIMFGDKWLKHAGMYPAYQVRFGTKDQLRFKMVGHGQREMTAPEQLGKLTGHIDHYNFSKGTTEWFHKHARYAADEALLAVTENEKIHWRDLVGSDGIKRRRAAKQLAFKMPFRPALRFFYTYVVRRGFLDGKAGFNYCKMMATYQSMIDINQYELELKRKNHH